MEVSYESADARVRAIGGTSAEHLSSFVAWLGSRQYSAGYVCIVARHALAVGRWCEGRGIDLGALTDDAIERYQRSRARRRSRRPETRRQERQALTLLLHFLRFGEFRGEVPAGLAAGVPSVATWTTTPPIPKAIAAEHAQRAIDSCDRSTAVGRRDRAVLLLLARLGLRACEVIRLALDDIDWEQAQLRVRGKGGRQSLLPLPTDVGAAIAAYLQHGRPTCEDRHLFLRSMAPIRGLLEGSDGVGSIVCRALKRAQADAPHRGSHQFRHALAAHMLRQGASLPEIGQVLRHRSPQSTSIYAKVDLAALRTLVMAWPGGAR